MSQIPLASVAKSPVVDIIIPVYKNLASTRNCLESVFASTVKIAHRIIVIDDASPEQEVTAYLHDLAQANKIMLVSNKENQGFVRSVNIGMQLHLQSDVVLLNSDTIVANDWLDRLRNCAYKTVDIATVTPFSNNATICSYPKICVSNSLPSQYSLEELDAFFASYNQGESIEIPTAVGFCMFIKRDCLNQIGYFDEKRFGKGYGEENDFCLRAIKRDWRNVIACDVFVYHEGSVSFGASKNERIEHAQQIIEKLYPRYAAEVQKFILQDKLLPYRNRIDLQRLQHAKLPNYLLIMHEGEGGVLKHVRDLVKHFDQQVNFLIAVPEENFRIKLYWANPSESFCLYFNYNEPALLIELLKTLGMDRIHIHHILGWKDIVSTIINNLEAPYDITIHDYYSFCPQINLITKQGFYCGLPEQAACQKCVNDRFETRDIDIAVWREKNQLFLEKAARVFVPSVSVLAIIRRYFAKTNFVLAAHLENNTVQQTAAPYLRPCSASGPLKILVLGALSKIKGADMLEECAALAKKNQQALEFHLLGFAYRKLKVHSQLYVYGKYEESNLQELIKQINPHLAWFPALCPETYSYTLSACFEAQLPVACTDLGAQAERLKGRSLSLIKPWQTSAEGWNEFFLEFKLNGQVMAKTDEQLISVEKKFQYDLDYLQDNQRRKLVEADSNKVLEQINLLKFRSFKRSLSLAKRHIYFLLLNVYSKMGISFFLPKEKLVFVKFVFQKFLLSGS